MAGATFEVFLSVEEGGRKKTKHTLDTDLEGEITLKELLEWTKSTLIVVADQVLREEQSRGFDKNPVMVIDGKKDKNIQNVSPLGQIEFLARQDFGAVLLEAYVGLLNRSKVLTGAYKASHFVFWNGVQVAENLQSLQRWLGFLGEGPDFKDGDIIRIVNLQPYARRLERLGVTAQRSKLRTEDTGRRRKQRTGVLVKLPNGAYQLTTRAIKAKYKNNVGVRFSFLPGSSLGIAGTFKSGRKGKNSAGRPYLYPTIAFTVQERGIK